MDQKGKGIGKCFNHLNGCEMLDLLWFFRRLLMWLQGELMLAFCCIFTDRVLIINSEDMMKIAPLME